MIQLECKLVSGNYSLNDALVDGKELLTQQTLELLQNRLLHIYLNIQQQKYEISRLAGELLNANVRLIMLTISSLDSNC